VTVRTIVLLSLLVSIAGCDAPSASPKQTSNPSGSGSSATPPKAALAVEATYLKLCAPCHAKDLKGYAADHAPSLINAAFLESAPNEFIAKSIMIGRPGTSMGAYGKALGGPLDDAQVDELVSYIRTRGPAVKAVPPGGSGNAQRGAPLYAEYCKTCHGDSSTRGEAPHLANAAFQRLASDPFIRYGIAKGRPGTKMLAFENVLKPEQIDDLVAYVRTLAVNTTPAGLLPEPTGKEPLVINPKGKAPTWKVRDGRFVSVDDVAKAYADKRKMIIIDARPPSEWRRARITDSVSIPYHDLARLAEVPADVDVVAYCACPHHLSGDVVNALIARGHKRAYVLDEGVNVWHFRKYPMTTAPGVQPPAAEPPKPDASGQSGHGHAGHKH
jgi:cytochrome c oxidase cbb3-type subunit 3/ubiquinol-cytochrome c reductase cytochrome c subunit